MSVTMNSTHFPFSELNQFSTEATASSSTTGPSDLHSPLLKALESISVFVIMLAAIIANLSVIIVIWHDKSLRRNGHNLLIFNLAVCDLGTSLCVTLVTFFAILNNGHLLQESSFLCTLTVLLSSVFYIGNFGAIIMIAVHRYFLVVQSNRLHITVKHSYVMIAVSCSTAIAVTSLTVALSSKPVYDENTYSCTVNAAENSNCYVLLAKSLIPYIIVVPVMIYCYGSIAIEIRKSQSKIDTFRRRVRSSIRRLTGRESNRGIQEDPEISSSQVFQIEDKAAPKNESSADKSEGVFINNWDQYEKEYQEICYTLRRAGSTMDPPSFTSKRSKVKSKSTVQKRDQKLRSVLGADKLVAIAGALVIITTLVCWTPYNILKITMCLSDKVNPSHHVWIICRFLSHANSAIDPLIYSMFNRGLHTALVRSYKCIFERIRYSCNTGH